MVKQDSTKKRVPRRTDAPAADAPLRRQSKTAADSAAWPYVRQVSIAVVLGTVYYVLWLLIKDYVDEAFTAPHPPLQCHGDEQQQFANLQGELSLAGADVQKVALGTFNGLRGIQVTVPLTKDDVILSVPLEWTISAASFTAKKGIWSATRRWQDVEDADMMLDALALLHERYVMGASSRWVSYLCLVPQEYGLPINYTTPRAYALLGGLPELQRLVMKRRAGLGVMLPLMRTAFAALPGGKKALGLMSADEFRAALLWAYAATKTRTVQLDLAKTEGYFAPLPQARGGWVTEFGAMVPVLDLANYAGGDAASANFAVRLMEPTEGQKHGALHFALLAARDLQAGEEVTFTYLPEDDEQPRCSDRWLLEYGFPVDDGHPARGCYTWNVTVNHVAATLLVASRRQTDPGAEVVEALRALAEGRPAGSSRAAVELEELREGVSRRLRDTKLPLTILAQVTRDGKIFQGLGEWLVVAIGSDDQATGQAWAMMLKQLHTHLSGLPKWARDQEAAGRASAATADAGAAGISDQAEEDAARQEGFEDTDVEQEQAAERLAEVETAGLLRVYEGALGALLVSLQAVGGQL